jgi:hypothetical protein
MKTVENEKHAENNVISNSFFIMAVNYLFSILSKWSEVYIN